MSELGRKRKHEAQANLANGKLLGLDAVLCFLSQFYYDCELRMKTQESPNLGLIRSLEGLMKWVKLNDSPKECTLEGIWFV